MKEHNMYIVKELGLIENGITAAVVQQQGLCRDCSGGGGCVGIAVATVLGLQRRRWW
ncbi:hypothetical protein Hanom_Chr15g01403521 [Helianthus anomalus]